MIDAASIMAWLLRVHQLKFRLCIVISCRLLLYGWYVYYCLLVFFFSGFVHRCISLFFSGISKVFVLILSNGVEKHFNIRCVSSFDNLTYKMMLCAKCFTVFPHFRQFSKDSIIHFVIRFWQPCTLQEHIIDKINCFDIIKFSWVY